MRQSLKHEALIPIIATETPLAFSDTWTSVSQSDSQHGRRHPVSGSIIQCYSGNRHFVVLYTRGINSSSCIFMNYVAVLHLIDAVTLRTSCRHRKIELYGAFRTRTCHKSNAPAPLAHLVVIWYTSKSYKKYWNRNKITLFYLEATNTFRINSTERSGRHVGFHSFDRFTCQRWYASRTF